MFVWSGPTKAAILALCIASPLAAHSQLINESSGEAVYEIPIVIPAGASGHAPDVALGYTSGTATGASAWAGLGWSVVAESEIARDLKFGPYEFCDSPTSTLPDPCYRNRFVLDGQDLVCDSPGCSVCTTGTCPGIYRFQQDDGRRIELLGGGRGGPSRTAPGE